MENTLAISVANAGQGRKPTESQAQYESRIQKENENIFKKPHSALWMSKGLKDKKGKQERGILNES